MARNEDSKGLTYPNEVRNLREGKGLTREDLAAACRKLAEKNSESYTVVSLSTLRNLEVFIARPKRKTAQTIAQALDSKIVSVFTSGVDDSVHNPTGKTRIPLNRKKGGRPRKSE